MSSEDPRGAKSGRLGRLHDRLLDAVMLAHQGMPLDRALDQVFRRARDLGAGERAEISEELHALMRAKRRLDDLLERAAKSLHKRIDILDAPVRARLEILTALADRGADLATLEERDSYAFKRIPGLFEKIVAKEVPEPKNRSAVERVAVEYSLPDWLATRVFAAYGEDETRRIGHALLQRAPFTLRVNRLKASRAEVIERIKTEHRLESAPTPLSPDGIVLERHASIHSWPLFNDGAIEVQDEGSQLIALALGAKPGDVVIDACAGAGGKTLAVAATMENRGRLIALDRDEDKLKELGRRARRAGLTNHEIITSDFIAMPETLAGRADRVLVDAPCTGSGVYRRHPGGRWRTTEADLERLAPRQLSLLMRAVDAVKPGGFVLYATCSVLREENEAIVERALQEERRFLPVPLALTLGEPLANSLQASHQVRIGPGAGLSDPDGYYFALLRRA